MPHYNAVGCRCRSAHRAPAQPGSCTGGGGKRLLQAVAGSEEKKKKILER